MVLWIWLLNWFCSLVNMGRLMVILVFFIFVSICWIGSFIFFSSVVELICVNLVFSVLVRLMIVCVCRIVV